MLTILLADLEHAHVVDVGSADEDGDDPQEKGDADGVISTKWSTCAVTTCHSFLFFCQKQRRNQQLYEQNTLSASLQ